jgi:hypothetical protein
MGWPPEADALQFWDSNATFDCLSKFAKYVIVPHGAARRPIIP